MKKQIFTDGAKMVIFTTAIVAGIFFALSEYAALRQPWTAQLEVSQQVSPCEE